nr:MAG TPA: hypothetical protein [Bacteriophage sp.]
MSLTCCEIISYWVTTGVIESLYAFSKFVSVTVKIGISVSTLTVNNPSLVKHLLNRADPVLVIPTASAPIGSI